MHAAIRVSHPYITQNALLSGQAGPPLCNVHSPAWPEGGVFLQRQPCTFLWDVSSLTQLDQSMDFLGGPLLRSYSGSHHL